MSNSLVNPALAPAMPTTDLSELDLARVEKYKEGGLPGIFQVKEEHLVRMLDLYLSGKPYVQISRILKLDKTIIMYLSQKYGWYVARQEMHHELEATIRNRVIESKVIAQDFLLQLSHLFQKKLGKQIRSYLATDDESHANAIDPKDVAQALKIMETLERMSSDVAIGKPVAPVVGLHLGEGGVTMTKNEDGSVDITPKQQTVKDMLKKFADEEREKDKK